jgi:hypothetical protein
MASLVTRSDSSDYYSTDSGSDSEDESELDFINRQKLDLKKKEEELGKERFNKVYAWKIKDVREREEAFLKENQKRDELEEKILEEVKKRYGNLKDKSLDELKQISNPTLAQGDPGKLEMEIWKLQKQNDEWWSKDEDKIEKVVDNSIRRRLKKVFTTWEQENPPEQYKIQEDKKTDGFETDTIGEGIKYKITLSEKKVKKDSSSDSDSIGDISDIEEDEKPKAKSDSDSDNDSLDSDFFKFDSDSDSESDEEVNCSQCNNPIECRIWSLEKIENGNTKFEKKYCDNDILKALNSFYYSSIMNYERNRLTAIERIKAMLGQIIKNSKKKKLGEERFRKEKAREQQEKKADEEREKRKLEKKINDIIEKMKTIKIQNIKEKMSLNQYGVLQGQWRDDKVRELENELLRITEQMRDEDEAGMEIDRELLERADKAQLGDVLTIDEESSFDEGSNLTKEEIEMKRIWEEVRGDDKKKPAAKKPAAKKKGGKKKTRKKSKKGGKKKTKRRKKKTKRRKKKTKRRKKKTKRRKKKTKRKHK